MALIYKRREDGDDIVEKKRHAMNEQRPSNQASRDFGLPQDARSVKAKTPDPQQQTSEDLPSDASELADRAFSPASSAELVAFAKEELQRRRLRAGYIPHYLLGEPAWMILLYTYISHHRGITASIKGICRTAELPERTAIRWVRALQDSELLRRSSGGAEPAITHAVLTPEGYRRIRAVLENFAKLKL